MKAFVLLSQTGEELRAIEAPSGDLLDAPEDGQWVEVPCPVRDWTAALVDGEPVAVPRETPPAVALEVAQSAKATEILQRRRRYEESPFTVDGQAFMADEASRNMLSSTLVLAREYEEATGQPFSTVWKLADGTTATLTRAQLRTVALTLGQRVQAAFTREATLRAGIAAAATVADVEAIVWTDPET